MRKLSLSCCGPAAALALLVLLAIQPANAAGSSDLVRPLPGDIVLGFNQGYPNGDGQTRYHTGLDISGDTGARVQAAGRGRVTFRGHVPGAGGSGERVLAVTVTMPDGRLATYLPMDDVSVSRGDEVRQGQVLGRLAGTGDGSSGSPHLHFSLRENGNYVDPSPLPLPEVPTQPRPKPQPSPTPVPAPTPHTGAQPRAFRPTTEPRPVATTVGQAVAGTSAATPRSVANRAPGAVRRAIARARATVDPQRLSRHRARLRANRARPWVDPRLLEIATDDALANHAGRLDAGCLKPPSARANPIGLLAASGLLLAAAGITGKLGRRASEYARHATSPAQPLAAAHVTRRG